MNTPEDKKVTAPGPIGPNSPIGVFDSGVGGLTVARTLVDQLPHESIIYIGDTAHGPYGPLSISQVRQHSQDVADELVARGCKMIVIACNTATAAFLRDARERYDVPVIGVILPAVRRAAATTRNGKVGVIGTQGTVNSGAYQELFEAIPAVECYAQPCPRFVDFVERGITSGRQILGVAEAYVEPLQAAGVDTLVLGCTHYPLLSGVIQLAMGDHVTLVSSAEETAKDVVRILSTTDMLAEPTDTPPTRSFESTGDPELFAALAGRFLGPHITSVSQVSPNPAN
ncbi:glutamate racemase [Corynebacterium aquilae]|uniref:Glutamate racemase n=1 Tax=Corynebacterium aquilae DSM 44791 TaxID=1431546 RepID=A0A1L7CHQ3_9CORY|nr:glutamate racemase [Corynebacterium aquilae]APT85349.1 glutamate racemase [Corynebacterium aquilae DSM 44791]